MKLLKPVQPSRHSLCFYNPQILRTYYNSDYLSHPQVLFPSYKAIFHWLRLLHHPTLLSSVAHCQLFSYNYLLSLSFFFVNPDGLVTSRLSELFIGLYRWVLLLLSPKPMLYKAQKPLYRISIPNPTQLHTFLCATPVLPLAGILALLDEP